MEITVVVDDGDRPRLEPRLAEITAATTQLVPTVQPNISIMSPRQWQHRRNDKAHHNVWLAPHTVS